MKIAILGVDFDNLWRADARVAVARFLSEPRAHLIVTPNPEMIMKAQKDYWFAGILCNADLAVADGVGIIIASRILGRSLPERVGGVDLMLDIVQLAAERGLRIYLLGSRNAETVKRAVVALNKATKSAEAPEGAQIVGAEAGPIFPETAMDFDPSIHDPLIARINAAHPDILLVAFGHGKQEKWLYHFLPRLPSVRLAMGVGGAFEIVSGKIRRAPSLLRALGLEWLWRLAWEPWRIGRIFTAVVRFLLLALRWRIHLSRPERPNVVAIIMGQDGKFLLVDNRFLHEREGAPHWEFLQGGVEDGETTEEALARELMEETGTDTFAIIRKLPIENFYELPPRYPRSGQRQQVFLVRFTGNPAALTPTEETAAYRWVSRAELMRALHPRRQKLGKKVYDIV